MNDIDKSPETSESNNPISNGGEKKNGFVTIIVIALILGAVGLFTFLSIQKDGGTSGSERDRVFNTEGATQFTTVDGAPADLSQFDGKVQVVNAWATWCPFCVQELPDLAELATEYADQDVAVIAINRKEDPARAKAFIDSLGGLPGITFIMDGDDNFYSSIGGFSMPETIFYDAEGNVVVHKRGFMALDEMRQHVEAALAASETND